MLVKVQQKKKTINEAGYVRWVITLGEYFKGTQEFTDYFRKMWKRDMKIKSEWTVGTCFRHHPNNTTLYLFLKHIIIRGSLLTRQCYKDREANHF